MATTVVNSARKMAVAKTAPARPENKYNEKSPKANEAKKETDRNEQSSLATVVNKGVQNATGAVVSAGSEVIKESAKSSLSLVLANFITPLRAYIQIPPLCFFIGPLTNFFTNKLENYMNKNNIDVGMKPSEIVEELLYGNIHKLSSEVTDLMVDFINKSLPENLKKAVESKNPANIIMAAGISAGTGFKSIFTQMFKMPNSNPFTSPFKFMGAKIPYINRLSPKLQPWVAGGAFMMFGGLALRIAVKMTKWVLSGALLATGGVLVKKVYDMATKSSGGSSKSSGLMSALGSFTGGANSQSEHPVPGAAAKPGIGDMIKSASNIFNMFAGPKKAKHAMV